MAWPWAHGLLGEAIGPVHVVTSLSYPVLQTLTFGCAPSSSYVTCGFSVPLTRASRMFILTLTWNLAPSIHSLHPRVRRIYCLHLQGWIVNQSNSHQETRSNQSRLDTRLASSSTLKIEAVCSSENSVKFYHTTRCNLPAYSPCDLTAIHCLLSQAQRLLYVPPALTYQNSRFCPHSVSVCPVWFSQ
jgi:hypothetical protein